MVDIFILLGRIHIEPPKTQARPLDGLYGVGIAFDTYRIGGQIHYQNPEINLSNLDLFDGGDSLIFARWSSSFYYFRYL